MDELHKASEFEYEKWWLEQALRLGDLLFEVIRCACGINEVDSIWNPIKEKIIELNLPSQKCKRCDLLMPYFEWGIRSGYCDKCINELEDRSRSELGENHE